MFKKLYQKDLCLAVVHTAARLLCRRRRCCRRLVILGLLLGVGWMGRSHHPAAPGTGDLGNFGQLTQQLVRYPGPSLREERDSKYEKLDHLNASRNFNHLNNFAFTNVHPYRRYPDPFLKLMQIQIPRIQIPVGQISYRRLYFYMLFQVLSYRSLM